MHSPSRRATGRPTPITSRRSLIAGLVGTAAGAATGAASTIGATEPARADPTSQPYEPDPLLGFDVRDFGAVRGGTEDCTAAFQKAIKQAEYSYGRVLVPNGTWKLSAITVPKLVKIVGLGADVSYFASSTHRGGVNLVHDPDSTDPMITVDGNGVTLENLTMLGNGSAAPLLRVQNGFESRFSRLRLASVPGTALHVERVNNNDWHDVSINDCGSTTAAAMVVKSPTSGTNTNTFTCWALTIEGSPRIALDIAWGTSKDYFAEFVRIHGLHVECQQPDAAEGVIRIGNVRSVDLVSPFVYGGPGPLLVHDERAPRAGLALSGGIRLVGGTFLGRNPGAGGGSTTLVSLVHGDDFGASGTRFGQFGVAAIAAQPTYGQAIAVEQTTRAVAYDGSEHPTVQPR
jgi:hypothetical protein